MDNVEFDRKNASHSLAEVAVAIAFKHPLSDERLDQLEALPEHLQAEFPAYRPNKEVSFSVTDDKPSSSTAFNGWSFEKKSSESNLIDWQLVVEKNRLVLKTFAYENWKAFKPLALRHVQKVSELLNLENFPLQEVLVQYIDRFHWMIDEGQYSLSKFFKPESDYLPLSVKKNAGALWHAFQGWTEQSERLEYIHNLNIHTQWPKAQPHKTEVTAIVRCIGEQDHEGFNGLSIDQFTQILEKSHNDNKAILHGLLSKETQEAIGI